jgi:hypothetical protein
MAVLWATIGSSVVSALAAGFTAWMAFETRRLARATEQSVQAENESVRRQQDALMPILDLEWAVIPSAEGGLPHTFTLTVTNKGAGPAFAREITVRREVNHFELYRQPLRRAIITPGETVEGLCPPALTTRPAPGRLSSVSVWYQDVYDRWYRSRLVLRYAQTHGDETVSAVVVLHREFLRDVTAPTFTWESLANPAPVNRVTLAEGGTLVPYDPTVAEDIWHTVRARTIAQSVVVGPGPLSGGIAIHVRDLGFWWESPYPQFVLQVGAHQPFVVGITRDLDDPATPLIYHLVDATTYPHD